MEPRLRLRRTLLPRVPRAAPLVTGAALALATLVMAPLARADSLGDALGPRALAVGESLRAAAAGNLALKLNPAGLAMSRAYALDAFFGTGAEDGTWTFSASICDSMTTKIAACLGYDHLQADVPDELGGGRRRLHQLSTTNAVPLGDALIIGTTTRWVIDYDESVDEATPVEGSRGGFVFDVGGALRLGSSISLGVVGYNLLGSDGGQYPQGVGGGVALNPARGLVAAFDARHRFTDSTTRLGGGLEYFLAPGDAQQGFPLRIGYVHDTANGAHYLSGGLGYVTNRIGLDVAVRGQLSKGNEVLFQAGLRLFLPE